MKFLRRAEPIDPDLVLITDYLMRALEPEEMQAVKSRLIADYDFYKKVSPVIKVWRLPPRYFSVQPTLPGAAPQPMPSVVWSRRLPRLMWAAAAVAVIVIGVRGTKAYLRFTDARQDEQDRLMQRAPSRWVQRAVRVETAPGETKVAETSRRTRVAVRGDSRFLYQAVDSANPYGGLMWATLDGEAAIEVSPTEGIVMLKTWAGQVNLDRGSYAVRCAPGCSAMLVTVGAGLATLVADTTKPGLVLHSGEKGRMPKAGEPEKVLTGGEEWPPLASATEKTMTAIRDGSQQPAQTKAKP